MKESKLLPLGSIVLLKEGEKKLMIYGRGQIAADNKEEFDYLACLWPEGNLDEAFMYLFNHTEIENVFHQGYTDAEDLSFLEELRWG